LHNILADKTLRTYVRKCILALSQHHRDKRRFHLSLQQCDVLLSDLAASQRDANRIMQQHFAFDMFVCRIGVVAVGHLSLIINSKNPQRLRLFPEDWCIDPQCPDPDIIVQSLLTQIANHALAALRLSGDGLDNPARVVCRALHELSWKLIILSCDRKVMAEYAKAHTPEEASKVWYKHFSKKTVLKRIKSIQNDLGFPITGRDDFWSGAHEYYSQEVHSSMWSVSTGSFGRLFGRDEYVLTLYGLASESSRSTVAFVLETLGFVVMFYPLMLVSLYGFSIPAENEQWQLYWSLRELCLDMWLSWKKQQEERAPPQMSLAPESC